PALSEPLVARQGLVGLSVTKHRSKRRRRPKTTAPQVPPRAPRRTPTSHRPERLNAPWHPFPLVELSVLVGIICIAVGLFAHNGQTLIALGVALGALGGLDTTVREHFNGYREHTLVLAAFPAVALAVIAAVAKAPLYVVVLLMAVVFVAAAFLLR